MWSLVSLPFSRMRRRLFLVLCSFKPRLSSSRSTRDNPCSADVDTFLRASGFQFHTLNGFSGRAFKPLIANGDVNSAFRQALWSDALYVRDWMRLDRLDDLSEAKLRNYAILAHDVLRSYDLAHLVLSALDSRTGGNRAAHYLGRLTEKKPNRRQSFAWSRGFRGSVISGGVLGSVCETSRVR
jgi:hypothetical protein